MKKILFVVALLSLVFVVEAQKNQESKKEEKLLVKVKEGADPDIYVDGKKFDFPMDLLNPDKIVSVSVIKDRRAVEEYNAPNGVILITTQKTLDTKPEVKIKGKAKSPLIIIDGEVSDQESLQGLLPDEIIDVKVLKGEEAIKKYNAPNGVIVVATKKGAK